MDGGREIYFEHTVVGRQVKVTAICSVTHVEVSVFGPVAASQHDLETLALRKLEAKIAADRPKPPLPRVTGGGRSGTLV
jgi:hypothetical protein